MKILRIIGTLNPEYGGPVEALKQSVLALKQLGHTNEIVTLDRKYEPGVSDFPAVVYALGPSIGIYRYTPQLVPWLVENVHQFDAIIVHGIWQYQSLATWLASKKVSFPYFVFVHGALDPWFKKAYPLKHIKKRLYWPWAEYRVLRDAAGVLFTSEEERILASKSFGLYKANEIVVKYGTNKPELRIETQTELFFNFFPSLREKHFILFLSRIHPKKGVDILLEAFSKVSKEYPDINLVLAGPDQDGAQVKLNQYAIQLDVSEHIFWTGLLRDNYKWGAFQAADAFILPSHSENFGIAVVEALACGVPVLITDKINIWREIAQDKAGLIETDTVNGVVTLLKQWLSMDDSMQEKMRNNALKCFSNHFEARNASQSFIASIQKFI